MRMRYRVESQPSVLCGLVAPCQNFGDSQYLNEKIMLKPKYVNRLRAVDIFFSRTFHATALR